MKKQELEELKSLFIDSYVDNYVMDAYQCEMVTDLDNLCKEFAKHQNEELIEEKSKTIRFLADKLEIEQLKNKELIDNIKLAIDNLEEKQKSFLGTSGEIPRANFKLGLDWAIESFKMLLSNDNQKTQEASTNQIGFNVPL